MPTDPLLWEFLEFPWNKVLARSHRCPSDIKSLLALQMLWNIKYQVVITLYLVTICMLMAWDRGYGLVLSKSLYIFKNLASILLNNLPWRFRFFLLNLTFLAHIIRLIVKPWPWYLLFHIKLLKSLHF